MRSQSLHPESSAVVLDYSQAAVRRVGPGRWIRLFWSHRARLELAQRASCAQGVAILAGISIIAGFLSTTHACLHALLAHMRYSQWSLPMLRQLLTTHWLGVIGSILVFAPVCFVVLAGLLVLLAKGWTWLMRPEVRWSQAFPVLSVGCVPLLWFFVLLQVESVAPFVSGANALGGQWNPVTNYVRFGMLMIGIALLGMWIIDGIRLYSALSEQGVETGPSNHP